MKARPRLFFLFSIIAALCLVSACSFSSSSDDDDDDDSSPQPVEVTDVSRTLKIEQLPCDNGIAICIKKSDGTPLARIPNESNSYGGNTQYFFNLNSEGFYSNNIDPVKWICPYVTPNEPITLHVALTREVADGNGIKKEAKDIAWDEITITPTTGLGRVTYEGKVNIEFGKSGDLKVTADSQTLKNYRGDYWNVVTDICTGKDWESLGSWMSNMYVRNDQFGQTFNLWTNSDFHHQILENGLTLGFLDSFIEYSYKLSDNESYSYKTKNAEGLGYRKGITLDSYVSYLQSQGLTNPFDRSFVEKFGTVVKYTMDANSSKGRLSYDYDGLPAKQCLYYACMVELSELSTNFQNTMPTAGNLVNWDDFNFHPAGTIRSYSANVLPEVGSPARNYFVELSYVYDIETKAYKVVYVNLLNKGALYNPNIHIENPNERPIYLWGLVDISGL